MTDGLHNLMFNVLQYLAIKSIWLGNIASQEVKIHKETHVPQNQRIEIS